MLHKRFVRILLWLAGSALLVSCNTNRATREPGAIQPKVANGPLPGVVGNDFRLEASGASGRRTRSSGTATVTVATNFIYWSGDFDGDGRSDVYELDLGTRKWRLGTIAGTTLSWRNLGTDHRVGSGTTYWVDRPLNEGGSAKILSYQSGSQDWWFTQPVGGQITLSQVTSTANYGDLVDGKHLLFFGDFDGDGNEDLLFNNAPDGNWFIGKSNGNRFTWSPSAINNGFGSLLDGDHILLSPASPYFKGGPFVVGGQAKYLFHYTRDGHWFSGSATGNWPTCSNTPLTWSLIGDTPGFGNLLDGTHSVWLADFDGDGNTDVLFYAALDGNWWLSTSQAPLVFKLVSNTRDLGNLLDADHEILTGDFAQVGHDAVVFHSFSHASWWIGTFEGGQIHWCNLTEQTIP